MLKMLVAVLAVALLSFMTAGAREASAGGACHGVPVTEGSGTAVEMTSGCFTPTILRVQAGETVTWTNGSLQQHTVTGANVGWGDFTELAPGESVTHEFTSAGAYAYYCFLHPGMVGTVVVEDAAQASAAAGNVGVAAVTEASRSSAGDRVLPAMAIVSGLLIALAVVTGAIGYALGRRRVPS